MTAWKGANFALEMVIMGLGAAEKKVDAIECPSIFPTNAGCTIPKAIARVIVMVVTFLAEQVSPAAHHISQCVCSILNLCWNITGP